MTSKNDNVSNRLQNGMALMRRSWLVLFLMVFFIALACVDRFLISLVVDPIKHTFKLDDSTMGLLQGAAFALFFLLASLPMGWLADRYSKRLLLFLGISAWSLATVAFGVVNSLIGLFVARAFLGIGQAVLQPVAWGIISKLFPAERLSMALSIFSSGAQAGVASSYLLGSFAVAWVGTQADVRLPIIGQVEPWQQVFLLAGLPGLVFVFLSLLVPAEKEQETESSRSAAGGLYCGSLLKYLFRWVKLFRPAALRNFTV